VSKTPLTDALVSNLEFAAKAMGLQIGWNARGAYIVTPGISGNCDVWNPLEDDGDALRLAVRLNITVHPGFVYTPTGKLIDCRDYANRIGATRLAIVRAAAEIGRNMPYPVLEEPDLTASGEHYADVWHEGSQGYYHAKLLRKLTPEEVEFSCCPIND
jgi:hypothetical protein